MASKTKGSVVRTRQSAGRAGASISEPRPSGSEGLKEALLALQWRQRLHDEAYHPDILALPVVARIVHMTLHFSKYTGEIAALVDTPDAAHHEKVVVDFFIIFVAAANALKLSLAEVFVPVEAIRDLGELGLFYQHELDLRDKDSDWFMKEVARPVGRLAKACESLDHFESYDFSNSVRQSVLAVGKVVLAEATRLGLSLLERTEQRLVAVEQADLFYRCRSVGVGG